MPEVERKFRLCEAVPAELLRCGSEITQYYLHDGEGEIRARKADDTYWLTVKLGEGMVHEEWERAIPAWVFEAFRSRAAGFLRKTRYRVASDAGPELEIDRYHGALTGLWILEVEFQTVTHSREFSLPAWAAGAREVTGDRLFKNAFLSGASLPPE